MMDAKSSGAELPAAMKVAPATSSLRSNFCTDEAKFRSVVTPRLTATPTDQMLKLPRRSSPTTAQSIRRMLWRGPETCRGPRDGQKRRVQKM